MNGYIVKPFTPQMLRAKIELVFATRASAIPDRQGIRAPQFARSGDASEPAPASDSFQLKFPGRFTSDF